MISPVVLNSSCEPCRQSKVKCSGEPVCERCKQKGYNCVYNPRKKRGKAREYGGFQMPGSGSNNGELVCGCNLGPDSDEVMEFCLENSFPIKFMTRLRKANIKDFTTAAQITEDELFQKFGELNFEQLLKWRAKIKQELMSNFCQKPPITQHPHLHGSLKEIPIDSMNTGKHFDESQCAQLLTTLNNNLNLPRNCSMQGFQPLNNVNLKYLGFDPAQHMNMLGLSTLGMNSSTAGSFANGNGMYGMHPALNNNCGGVSESNQSMHAFAGLNSYVQNLLNSFCPSAKSESISNTETLISLPEKCVAEVKRVDEEMANTDEACQEASKHCFVKAIMNKMNYCKKRKCEYLSNNKSSDKVVPADNSLLKCEEADTTLANSVSTGITETASADAEKSIVSNDIKSKMQVVDWLVGLLDKMLKLNEGGKSCNDKCGEISELTKCLNEISIKINHLESSRESLSDTTVLEAFCNSNSKEDKDVNLEELQNETFDLLTKQFEKLKMTLKKSKQNIDGQ